MDPVKPGWKTTEFWASVIGHLLSVAVLAVGTMAEAQTPGSGAATVLMILGVALEICTLLGYQVSRTLVKTGDAKAKFAQALAALQSGQSDDPGKP